jgi:protein-tyrosine phosphatase
MPAILFVCTANRFRSPLAAAFLGKVLEENGQAASWVVGSAGTWAEPGQTVIPAVLDVALEYGLSLTAHRATRVSGPLLADYDIILVMQSSQREALRSEFPSLYDRIYLLSNVVERRSYDIPDSSDSPQQVAEVGAELYELIRRGWRNICALATVSHSTRNITK